MATFKRPRHSWRGQRRRRLLKAGPSSTRSSCVEDDRSGVLITGSVTAAVMEP